MIHSYYYNAWFPPLPLHENRWIDDDAAVVVCLVAGGSCSTTEWRSFITYVYNIVQHSGLFIIIFLFHICEDLKFFKTWSIFFLAYRIISDLYMLYMFWFNTDAWLVNERWKTISLKHRDIILWKLFESKE